ncbi:hypothetical protein GGR54DRAFT_632156 [Hypoxylon sp. NC1633]|nr:hypothetical protein GGR54DRAFT_632156 [Hypoxylon sp. NC1633]
MPALPIPCTSAYSSSHAAKSFVRLLCASSSSPIGSSTSILDILLPPRARAFHLAAARGLRPIPAIRTRNRSPRIRRNDESAIPVNANVAHRSFSATAPWRMTKAVHNPQKDEDGNDMLLEITPRAANRLSQIMAKDKDPHMALRISVESGGCHGFQYLISPTSLPASFPSAATAPSSDPHPPETSSPPRPATLDAEKAAAEVTPSTTTSATPSEPSVGEDDTIFAFVQDPSSPPAAEAEARTEATAKASGSDPVPGLPKVILDAPSLELLKGSKLDFTMELIGSQFKIVDNPAASSSCGCGTSFDIKF